MTTQQLVLLLNTVISVFLPALVGLVTTRATNPAVRSVLLLVLAIVNTLVGQIVLGVQSGDFEWFNWVLAAIASFVIGVSVHYGFWRPTGVSDKLVGIGSR